MIRLSLVGAAQADDSANISAIDKRDIKQLGAFGNQANHAQFTIVLPFIHPNQCRAPIKLWGQSEGQAMLGDVGLVFEGVKRDVLLM